MILFPQSYISILWFAFRTFSSIFDILFSTDERSHNVTFSLTILLLEPDVSAPKKPKIFGRSNFLNFGPEFHPVLIYGSYDWADNSSGLLALNSWRYLFHLPWNIFSKNVICLKRLIRVSLSNVFLTSQKQPFPFISKICSEYNITWHTLSLLHGMSPKLFSTLSSHELSHSNTISIPQFVQQCKNILLGYHWCPSFGDHPLFCCPFSTNHRHFALLFIIVNHTS